MRQQRINRFFVTLHHIEHAVGQTGFLKQIRDEQGWGRV